jgi:DNA-binding protein HU-beta
MTKQELIEKVFATPNLPPELTKKTVATLVDAVFAELGDYFVKAKVTRRATPRFTYPGFGTFTKKRKNGRAGRNPQTGAPIVIPPSTTVSFAPGQELKAFLNRTALKSQG